MPDHDQSGRNTDADLMQSARFELPHRRGQLKPSPYGSLGVILVGLRITKINLYAVPQIACYIPAEAAHGLGNTWCAK
jgi:hypothetical protein